MTTLHGEHTVVQQITIIPRREDAHIDVTSSFEQGAGEEISIKFGTYFADMTIDYGPSKRKQKLLDAGYSETKAVKILDALGEL